MDVMKMVAMRRTVVWQRMIMEILMVMFVGFVIMVVV